MNPSPWPLTGAAGAFYFFAGLSGCLQNYDTSLMLIGGLVLLLTLFQWWRDVIRESLLQGKHTKKVEDGLRMGMTLFIISEIFFFISFFWAFFHSSLSPSVEIGSLWPPVGVQPPVPFEVPLLNTTLLLSSGATITWGHMALLSSEWYAASSSIALTIALGMLFSLLQYFEYLNSFFTAGDSVYGSTYYIATGFHGLHVILGTVFIIVMWSRHVMSSHFSNQHHFGFEASAWYWHFVDVIWLFLFMFIYWWGY